MSDCGQVLLPTCKARSLRAGSSVRLWSSTLRSSLVKLLYMMSSATLCSTMLVLVAALISIRLMLALILVILERLLTAAVTALECCGTARLMILVMLLLLLEVGVEGAEMLLVVEWAGE